MLLNWAVKVRLFLFPADWRGIILLFPAEISRDFAPDFCFPFQNRDIYRIVVQPVFCTGNQLEQVLVFGVGLQFGLALLLSNPQLRVDRVAIDRVTEVFLFLPGKGMNDSQKLADIVRAVLKRRAFE